MRHTAATRSRVLPAAGLALTALIVAGCGSAHGATKTAGAAPAPSAPAGSRGGFGNVAAATGKATAVSSSGVKVATSSGTTVVAWATSTRFTKVTAGSRSSVAVGDCVTASSSMRRSSSTPPSQSTTAAITATNVTVTGTSACAARSGFTGRGPGGVRPSGAPTTRPTGRPTGRPGGFGRGGGGGFGGLAGGAIGTVTSISGPRIVLKTQGFGSTTATSRTVTTTAATTYKVSSTASSAAVATGQCVAAVGSKATDGTLDALSITLSTPTGGACSAAGIAGGFGGRGFPGGGAGQQGGGAPPQGGSNA
jgi:hypothetical protein